MGHSSLNQPVPDHQNLFTSLEIDDHDGRTRWRRYQGPRQEAVYSPVPFFDPNNLVGKSEAFQRVHELVRAALETDQNVLIQGESGTGKSLLARFLHAESEQSENWLIVVNCNLVEVGDLKPLMVGPPSDRENSDFGGIFDIVLGGTLVFDEVDALSGEAQARLDHILETYSFKKPERSFSSGWPTRLVSIASADFSRDGFKSNLFDKLAQFPIAVPPLRNRSNDPLHIARYYLRQHAGSESSEHGLSLSEEAMDALLEYSWPGNVRELRNVIERAADITSSSVIEEEDLLLSMQSSLDDDSPPGGSSQVGGTTQQQEEKKDFGRSGAVSRISDHEGSIPTIEELKKEAVEQAYELCNGNVDRAAVELGVSRSTMYRMLKRYDIK